MKKKYYFFVVIFSYLLFLIATIPASLMTSLVNQNTPVKIQGASGTLWNGQASTISINNIADLADTEWTFAAWKLFTGRVAFQISTHYDEQQVTGEAGVSFLKQFFVNDLSAKISAENIIKLIDIPLVQLSGTLALDIEHAHWKTDELPLASGNIIWNDAVISVAETVSLGNLTIVLSENDQRFLSADIKNKGGDILVSGKAELVPEKSYSVNVKLTPTDSASDSVEESLSLFAQKQRNGDFLFKKTGPLNQLGLE